jgi:glutathione S-transferase
MKLIGSPASPFVRKVRVLLIEKGHGDVEVEMHDPWSNSPELLALNPLSRVPALVLSNGVVFYDSKMIVDYIESTMPGPRFIPESGAARWYVLQAQAHADNLLDIGIRSLLERRRPAEKQIKDKIMRDELAVARGITSMGKIIKGLDTRLNLGHISLAVALGWVDFRLPHIKWREKQPSLSAWYQDMRLRPSMQSTAPE